MSIWKAINTCTVEGTLVAGDGYISLTDEQERRAMVGKYAKKVPDEVALRLDPKSKAMKIIGNKNLIPATQEEIKHLQGKPMDEGAILYPPMGNPIQRGESSDGFQATQFQTVR